jgi:hypothetical protein
MVLTKDKSEWRLFNFSPAKSYSKSLLIIIFFASLFYTVNTRGGGGIAFRIAYSGLLYLSIILITKVYFSWDNRQKLANDRKYTFFMFCVMLFTVCNTLRDFFSPEFSNVTLFNNSRALMTVLPIFGFTIGYNTIELRHIHRFINVCTFLFICYVFYIFINEPSAPKVFTCFVLPFVVFNLTLGRFRILSFFVLIIAAIHSIIIDYRALLLRVIFFAGFFIALNIFKKNSKIKFIIIASSFLLVYIFLTHLPEVLALFQMNTNAGEGMGTDTRTFLYTELFDDLKPGEAIIGRGFLGTYFSPVIFDFLQAGDFPDSFNRFSVEVGVLELILKGGYIFLILFLAPLIYVTWKGLKITSESFRLEYNICIYLLTELLIFLFENSPSYHIHFFMLFFFAGYVYNKLNIYQPHSYNVSAFNKED